MSKSNDLHRRASANHGVLGRADLADLGITTSQRRMLVSNGTLQLVGRRTYLHTAAPRTLHQRVRAATIDGDGHAAVAAGAWLHGLSGFHPGPRPSILTRRAGASDFSPIAQIHSTRWLPPDDVTMVRGIPTLSLARTILSLAAALPVIGTDALAGAVDEAIRDGKASDAWLWWMLERTRRRGRPGVAALEAVLTARMDGAVTESWLERELLRLLAAAGVPPPVCQQRIDRAGAFVARVDFLYVDQRLVIEVSGHVHHSTKQQLAADVRRRNGLQLAGYRVIEFTYDQVVKDPAYVVAEILEALGIARRRAG